MTLRKPPSEPCSSKSQPFFVFTFGIMDNVYNESCRLSLCLLVRHEPRQCIMVKFILVPNNNQNISRNK